MRARGRRGGGGGGGTGARAGRSMPSARSAAPAGGYDWHASTAENHAAAARINESIAQGSRFVGEFAHLRAARDHAFHGFYTVSRQLFQDSIVRYYVSRQASVNRRARKGDSHKSGRVLPVVHFSWLVSWGRESRTRFAGCPKSTGSRSTSS